MPPWGSRLAPPLARRRHENQAAPAAQAPDPPLLAPLEPLDDLALGPAPAVGARDARDHAVAGHHFAHLLRSEEQILPAFIAR